MQIPNSSTSAVPAGTIVYAGANPQAAKKTLSQGDFIKLLSTQLSAQDPLNPMKDTEFVAQMASFSALDQSRQLNEAFAEFSSGQSMLGAGHLIGRQVTIADPTLEGVIQGKVDAAALKDGVATVEVKGTSYPVSLITRIADLS